MTHAQWSLVWDNVWLMLADATLCFVVGEVTDGFLHLALGFFEHTHVDLRSSQLVGDYADFAC